jgi:spore maturation protein CgeB
MKILLAGDWNSIIYEEPLYQAFMRLGADVHKFSWHQYFATFDDQNSLESLIKKIQNKFLIGPLIHKVNQDLVEQTLDCKPDVLFVFRGSHIGRSTLERIRKELKGIRIFGYNNDDPYSPKYRPWVWRKFKHALPSYDMMYAYRNHNIQDFLNAGAKRSRLLRSWYLSEYNFPTTLTVEERSLFESDVTFIGHYEDDGRLSYIENLINGQYKFRLFGTGWQRAASLSPALASMGPILPVRGHEYNLAINGAKVALCFLSKLNRDSYTRRCFEIPASGSVLLSEYSDDLAKMFEPDREAFYFRSEAELIFKLETILKNESLRMRVREAAFRRLKDDGHDVMSRASLVLQDMV